MSQEISGARYELLDLLQEVTRICKYSSVAIHNVKTPGSLEDTDYGTFDVMVVVSLMTIKQWMFVKTLRMYT